MYNFDEKGALLEFCVSFYIKTTADEGLSQGRATTLFP
jgi:hypothetical protein